jgi:putative membrane protein
MTKMNLIACSTILVGSLVACNSSSDTSTTTSDSTHTSTTMNTPGTDSMNSTGGANSSSAPVSKTPLNAGDSTFVMKAAAGGMMEVNAGNTAQANAANDRVKGFGTMMVNDHSKANSELMSLASSKGLTLPSALPADMQKHVDEMAKLKGKSFDSHYMSMMLNDHKKDIADFEKEAASGNDPDLKAWASKTLPTLKAHLDSAQAISKMKM